MPHHTELMNYIGDYARRFDLLRFVERWVFSKFVEATTRESFPMKKYGMVPNHCFFQAMTTCLVAILPDKFYDKVEEGSIVLKQSKSFEFCKEGVIVDGDSMPIKVDMVIFCTGFKGDQKLVNIFSSPLFQSFMAGSLDSTVPLYRDAKGHRRDRDRYKETTTCPSSHKRLRKEEESETVLRKKKDKVH